MNNRMIAICGVVFGIIAALLHYTPGHYNPKPWLELVQHIVLFSIVFALLFFSLMKLFARRQWTFIKSARAELTIKLTLATIISYVLFWRVLFIFLILFTLLLGERPDL